MKNLFALLGLSLLVFGVVGWHQGWYKLNFSRNADGTLRVQTDLDTNKVVDDSGQVIKRASEFVEEKVGKSSNAAASTPATPVAPLPMTTTATAPAQEAPLKEGAGWLLGHVLGNQPANP